MEAVGTKEGCGKDEEWTSVMLDGANHGFFLAFRGVQCMTEGKMAIRLRIYVVNSLLVVIDK